MTKPFEILLVEDNPGDILLTRQAFKLHHSTSRLSVVHDGVQAMEFLRREDGYSNAQRPDLILLDLNLPIKSGREVLAEIKMSTDLRLIPVVVLSTSKAREDILGSFELNANSYIVKPSDVDQFFNAIGKMEDFWSSTAARLPH